MARARDPCRDKAYKIWEQADGEIKLKNIADQLGISEGTVRGWKNKDKWELPNSKAKASSVVKQVEPDAVPKSSERSNQSERNAPNVPKDMERSNQAVEHNDPPPEIDNEDGSLTDKQRLFVLEYLRDFNATRAAMSVGYSKKTAHVIGWENLRKPNIQVEIKRQKEAVVEDLGVGVQRVIAEYMKIAFADISEYVEFGQQDVPMFTEEGTPILDPKTGEHMTYKRNFVAFRSSEEVDGTLISEVKQGKDGVSIKLHDKMKALAALEKYLGFMTEEQRLKVEKMKLDIRKIQSPNEDEEQASVKDWVSGIQEIAARRRKKVTAHE